MNGQRNFEKYIRGVCVVENGDILRGPPRKVKVSLHHLDAPAPRWCCCCWPRTPSCDKVAKFKFNKQKSEASLQKYTSLETAIYMNGMVFQEYWKPGKAAVKVSVTQRRGKKLVLFARLTTFLDEMRDRETEQFVLYVTVSGFRIITKDKTASGGEEKRAPQKKTRHASRQKGECDKSEHYEKKEKIDYMTSLLTSFKEKKEEPAQILTCPEVVKLPPVIPMLAVQTNNLTASRCSPFHKEAPAAREQHATASRPALRELQPSMNRNEQQSTASCSVLREAQPSKNRKELDKKVQMVQVQGKDERSIESEKKTPVEGKETAAWEGKDEKEETNTVDVENAASETESRDKEEKDNTEKQDGKKEDDQGIMSEVQLVQEGEDKEFKSHEKNTGEEEEAPAWEDYGEDETEKVETDTGDVEGIPAEKNTDEEEKDADRGDITKKEKEPGTMSDMQLVQEGDDEDPKGEEESPREGKETEAWEDYNEQETGKKEMDAEELSSVPPEKECTDDWEDYDEHDTGKQETVTEEVNSVPPEKECTDDWEDCDEHVTGKQETVTEEVNCVPPEKECTDDWEDYDEHDTGKQETDTEEVNSVPLEKENTEDWEDCDEYDIGKEETDADEMNSVPPGKEAWEDYNEHDFGKEMDADEVNSVPPEKENTEDWEDYDEHDTGKEETDADEVNSVPPEKENTEHWEDYDEHDTGKEETDADEVNSVPPEKDEADQEVKEDAERECVSLKVKEPGIMIDTQMVQEGDYEDAHSEEKSPAEEETATEGDHETKKETDAEEPTPVRKMTPRVKAKKELDLRKKTLPCSYKRNVLSLKRNRKASGEKKKRYKRINVKSVRSKIDSHRSVPADYKPEVDLSVLESQPPPPGPARVRWAREVAALRTRLRTRKQTSARSLVHGSRAAHR
ncbi:eukaryotic translation initiation factor 5B-like [Scylla paramamosain]|uniref:eukaryotic translation initiation factor 5B-like n=1 Tax=Scylla paramamosain TaxID=85552 RepID=UPI003083CC7B